MHEALRWCVVWFTLGLALLALLIWWASWALGMALYALVLRVLVESGSLATLLLQPPQAAASRALLQGIARGLYFIGAPAWLLWRLLAG